MVDQTIEEPARSGSCLFPDTLSIDDPMVFSAANTLDWALRQRAPALYADAAAQLLAFHVLASTMSRGLTEPTRGLAPSVLARLIDYMRAHLDSPITLDDLSAVANLSKYHLLRQAAAICVLSRCSALRRLAPSSRVPDRSVPLRLAPDRFATSRLAPDRCAR